MKKKYPACSLCGCLYTEAAFEVLDRFNMTCVECGGNIDAMGFEDIGDPWTRPVSVGVANKCIENEIYAEQKWG